MIDALLTLPYASTLHLTGPYRLTVEEFEAMPVSQAERDARETIYQVQDVLVAMALQDNPASIHDGDLVPVHRFTKGVYTRELTMPPGAVIVGKRHAQEHLVVVTEGRCACFTERGWEEIVAPCTFTSPAGEKRVLLIRERTTWMTIHRTDATTPEDAERDLILPEPHRPALNSPANRGRIT